MTWQALKRTSTGKQSQRWRCVLLNKPARIVTFSIKTTTNITRLSHLEDGTQKKIHIYMWQTTRPSEVCDKPRQLRRCDATFGVFRSLRVVWVNELWQCLPHCHLGSGWVYFSSRVLSYRPGLHFRLCTRCEHHHRWQTNKEGLAASTPCQEVDRTAAGAERVGKIDEVTWRWIAGSRFGHC